MRNLLLGAVLAALLLAQAAFGAGATVRPQLRIADASPFTVIGNGFPGRQHVTVTVTGKGIRLSKVVMSTAAGRFSAVWTRTLQLGSCNHGAISAVAANGTKASWKAPPELCGAQPIDP